MGWVIRAIDLGQHNWDRAAAHPPGCGTQAFLMIFRGGIRNASGMRLRAEMSATLAQQKSLNSVCASARWSHLISVAAHDFWILHIAARQKRPCMHTIQKDNNLLRCVITEMGARVVQFGTAESFNWTHTYFWNWCTMGHGRPSWRKHPSPKIFWRQ